MYGNKLLVGSVDQKNTTFVFNVVCVHRLGQAIMQKTEGNLDNLQLYWPARKVIVLLWCNYGDLEIDNVRYILYHLFNQTVTRRLISEVIQKFRETLQIQMTIEDWPTTIQAYSWNNS